MGFLTYLIVVLIIIAAAFTIIIITRHIRKKKLEYILLQRSLAQRQASAYIANATIIQAYGGMTGEQGAQARFELSLKVLAGQNESYQARTTWLVDINALDYMKAGNTVSIRIDREDRNIIYPGASWAKYVMC
ncbi:MAG: hypothetical protein ABFD08_09280 [Syntrophomonas sp.]